MNNDFLDDLLSEPTRKPVRYVAKPKLRKQTKEARQVKAVKQVVEQAIKGQEADIKAIAKSVGRPENALVREAFSNFEDAVGGREAFMEILQHCPPTSVGAELVARLTADPETNHNAYSLYALCRQHKIPFNLVVTAFRDAKLAKIAIETLNQVASAVPDVVTQLVQDSQNHWEACTVCDGSGRITRINEQGEFSLDEKGDFVTQLCFECRGKGQKWLRHDFSNRSKLLDLAGLRPDRGPLVTQTFNQNANIGLPAATGFIPGDGSFENLMRAVEHTLKPVQPDGSAGGTLDAEIIQFEPEVPQVTPQGDQEPAAETN